MISFRSLKLVTSEQVVTQVVWWDTKYLYFDQRILTILDGIVRATGYVKIATVISIEDYIRQSYPNELSKKPPEIPLDLQCWIKSLEENQLRLRNECSSDGGGRGGDPENGQQRVNNQWKPILAQAKLQTY